MPEIFFICTVIILYLYLQSVNKACPSASLVKPGFSGVTFKRMHLQLLTSRGYTKWAPKSMKHIAFFRIAIHNPQIPVRNVQYYRQALYTSLCLTELLHSIAMIYYTFLNRNSPLLYSEISKNYTLQKRTDSFCIVRSLNTMHFYVLHRWNT